MAFGQKLSKPIEDLKNLGPKSGKWLRGVGINTISDLEEVGVEKAYCLLKIENPKMSRNMLHAMMAGLMDIHYSELPIEIKTSLDEKVSSLLKDLT